MQDIQQQAMQTYRENLEYFKQKHPELHKKLEVLESAISLGSYREKYALEYKQEGYFDVEDLSSGEWLYGEDSQFYSNQIVHRTNFKRKGGIFNAQRFIDFSPEMPDIIDKSKLSFHNALWATIKIVEYNRKIVSKETLMQSVFKTIFIGTGLGLHIASTIDKLHSKVAFIMEKDLELFRLSLFVTNYANLAKTTELFFSILEDEINERKNFVNFLEMANNYNLYIKHIPFIDKYEPILNRLQTHVLSQSHIMYGYSAILLRYIESPKYIARNYSFINVAKRYDNSFISTKPILFVFSGPSSGNNIEWIKKNKDRFVIVTALSTCRLLHKYGIKPDIVIHIDPGKQETQRLFEGIESSYFDDIIAIFGPTNDEQTVARFKKENIFFVDQDGVFKKGFGNLTSLSVGEYTYALFLVFGCQEVYLLGLDLALDNETLSTHSENHPFAKIGTITQEKDVTYDYKKAVEYTKGNFLEKVPSLTLYIISIQEFARFTNLLKQPEQKIYNLGNGAFLEGAEPKHIESVHTNEYQVLQKENLHQDLKEFLNSISSSEFRKADKEAIKKEIKEAKKLLKLVEVHKKQLFVSSSFYLDSVASLSWNLSDMEYKTNSC